MSLLGTILGKIPFPAWMFKLRGSYTSQQGLIYGIIGFLLMFVLWALVTLGDPPIVEPGILANPFRVFYAYGDLYRDNDLIRNLCMSMGFNLGGYLKAILLSIPIGFLIGLYPVINATFQAQVDAFRFVPLTAVTAIFMIAFGIQTSLKMNFLAFGIMIYLIPIIVQRIKEVSDVYVKTVYTIGATDWQTIKTVYFPAVLSKLSDDIRVLTAISWTYIIVAEQIGDQGGLGSLIYKAGQRMGRPDKTFAILLLFIFIGLIQDRLFVYLDKKFFPHKYQIKDQHSGAIKEPSIFESVFDYATSALVWILLVLYVILAINEYFPFIENFKPLSYLFKDTLWVIHVVFISIIIYKAVGFFKKRNVKEIVPSKTITSIEQGRMEKSNTIDPDQTKKDLK